MAERRAGVERLVEWLVAGCAGAALLCLSDLLVPPSPVPFGAGQRGHGECFVEMAQAPLQFTGMFSQRVLWPLLAHAAGWLGVGPIAFSQVCNGALLAVVFWFCRQRGASRPDATLVTAAVAASGAVLVYKPMACLSDSLVLLLLVLAVHFVARAFVFWALVLVAALAHEMVFFFAPWLVWLRCRGGNGSLRRDGALLAGALAAYAAWRALVAVLTPAGAPVAKYDAIFYITQNFWVPWGLPAMWLLWALVVLAEFGPLLAVTAWAWRRGELGMGGRLGPWLYLACVLSLMLLAYDVMRFSTFAFLPLVLGGRQLVRSRPGRHAMLALIVASCCTYVWHHPIPGEQGGRQFTDVSGHIRELLLAGKGLGTPGEAWSFALELLVRTWPVAAAAAGSAAVVAMLAVLLARYVDTANDAGGEPRTMRNASP